MRSREEIKADFERASPKDVLLTNEKEYLNWQRQKLLLEALQILDEKLVKLLMTLIERESHEI